MKKKPLVVGALVFALVLVIVVGLIFLSGRLARSAGPLTTPAADQTATTVAGQSATQAGPQATSPIPNIATATIAAAGAGAPEPTAQATATQAAPAAPPAAPGDFSNSPPGIDAHLVKTGNLRDGPGTEHKVLALLDGGTPVRITAVNGSRQWARVVTTGGLVGWLYLGNLDLSQGVNNLPTAVP